MLSWFAGKTKSNSSEITALQILRTRQIEQLKLFNQNVSEVQRDVEYRVNTIVNGSTISLLISLPPRFPQEKPIVKVSPPVAHCWVNDQMLVVGSSNLNNFIVHSDLGKVIKEIIEEFHRNPPTMLPQQSCGSYPYQAGSTGQSTGNPSALVTQCPAYSYSPQQPDIPHYITSIPMSVPQRFKRNATTQQGATSVYSNLGDPVNVDSNGHSQSQLKSTIYGEVKLPELPDTLKAKLQQLSDKELQGLLDDENKMSQMLTSLPEVAQIMREQEQCLELNEQLARSNLSLKPVLEEKKKVLLEKYDALNEVKAEYDKNAAKQEQLRQYYTVKHIQDNLKVAAMQSEEESENIAEMFLDGRISTDDFKKNYMDKRKLSHLRHAKEERLGQL